MKPTTGKTIAWTTVALVALAAAGLLASGRLAGLAGFTASGTSAAPVVRNKIPDADEPPATDTSEREAGSAEPSAAVTRTFFKPLHTTPAQAVRMEITAVEKNHELLISGKLFDGSNCKRLQIDLELQAEDGRKIFHTLILGDIAAAGQRPIRSKRRLSPSSDGPPVTWRARVSSLRCLQP